ncbi:MAG: DUF5723 family protein, partial [Flavobacteriales bacterium]
LSGGDFVFYLDSGGTIDGHSLTEWAAATSAKLAAAENVHVLNRTTVVGHWHHNFLMLFERVADHDPALLSQGVPRHRLWKVRSSQVILASGDTVANDQEWSLEEVSGMLGGLASGPAPLLSALLNGTHMGFSWVRVHELGISRMWGEREGWTLHTGVGGRLMLGNGYFSIDVEGDQMDAFGAFSNGLGVPSLAELSNATGTWDGLRKWGPVGQGWAVDAGAVLARKDGMWISASLTDIGKMEWRGERYTIGGIDIPDWEAGIEDPTSIEGIVGEALQPGTWFGEAVRETRRVELPTAFHAGAGKWFGTGAMLAADASLANGQALATETLRFGATALLRIGGWLFVDVGLRKVSESVFRIPAGIVIAAPEGGWQAGIRAGDIQALWKGSQPEVGMQMCFIRWAW